jgi:3-hydroxybutyryl-CoA dehydratase
VDEAKTSVRVGVRFSREHQFTPQEVMSFSLAAGDDNPLHIDPAHAAASPYGALIVSGTHSSALLLGLTASHFSKATSVVGRRFTVKFKRAVRADAKVLIEWRVVGLTTRASGPGTVVQLEGDMRDAASGEVYVGATGEVVIGIS